MSMSRIALFSLVVFGVLLSGGCASLKHSEPVDVIMVGIDPLQGQGLELRMLVKLRIQNPNDLPLDFNGVSVRMDVQGKPFATGVSDTVGSVPRFGETIVSVPVSISLFHIARQAMNVINNEYRGKLEYEMNGKLTGPTYNYVRFNSKGEFALPSEVFENGQEQ